MKPTVHAVCGLAISLMSGFGSRTMAQCSMVPEESQGTLAAPAPPSVDAQLEKASMGDITRDHLSLALSLALLSKSDLTVRQITFENMRVNGVPFYTAPLTSRLQLQAGQKFELPQPLQLTVYFRDVDSLKPLSALAEQGKAHAEGTLYLDVELKAMQKLFLFTSRAHVPVSFSMDVPVEIPGGTLAKTAAIRGLAAAEVAFALAKGKAESALNMGLQWRRELSQNYEPAMLFARTHFMLSNQKGDQVAFACTGPGFRVSSSRFVLLKELVEPWKFDPEMADAIKDDHFKVAPGSYELSVWGADQLAGASGDAAPAGRQSQGQISVLNKPADDEDTVLVPRAQGHPKKVQVHRRDSSANFVLLEFTGAGPGGSTTGMRISTDDKQTSWDSVAVFRFPGGAERKQPRPDLIFVAASKESPKLHLAASVDASAWGAPLISPQGVIGVIQSETSAVTWEELARILPINPRM